MALALPEARFLGNKGLGYGQSQVWIAPGDAQVCLIEVLALNAFSQMLWSFVLVIEKDPMPGSMGTIFCLPCFRQDGEPGLLHAKGSGP